MTWGKIAADVGRGLFAGFMGTLAMTASQTLEMRLRDRKPSTAPADAAAKVLGVTPAGDAETQRFSQLVHFGYGIGWGAVRGLVASTGLSGKPALLVHFAAVFGTGIVILPALDVAPPVSEWGSTEIAIDAWHHVVYAAAVSRTFERLSSVNS